MSTHKKGGKKSYMSLNCQMIQSTQPSNGHLKSSMNSSLSVQHQMRRARQKIRQHQLKIKQLTNSLMKKDITIKYLESQRTNLESELKFMKKDKQAPKIQSQSLKAFYQNKILEMSLEIQQLKQVNKNRQAPKDRYETCIRELDLLKVNFEEQQTKIEQERNYFKQIYLQIKSLVVSSQLSPKQLFNSLTSLFNEIENDAAKFTSFNKQNQSNLLNELTSPKYVSPNPTLTVNSKKLFKTYFQ